MTNALDTLLKAARAFAKAREALNANHVDQAALDRKQAAHLAAQMALITAAVAHVQAEEKAE